MANLADCMAPNRIPLPFKYNDKFAFNIFRLEANLGTFLSHIFNFSSLCCFYADNWTGCHHLNGGPPRTKEAKERVSSLRSKAS